MFSETNIVNTIRNRQTIFFGNIIKRKAFENIVMTVKTNGRRARLREVMPGGLTQWYERILSTDQLIDMYAYTL